MPQTFLSLQAKPGLAGPFLAADRAGQPLDVARE
jgi:hypothetical protein